MAGRRGAGDRAGFGRWAEDFAARYLQAQGYGILARNYRCEAGEADIVAQEGEALVVIEVKARRSARYGSPSESVTPAKARRLLLVLETYRFEHPESPPDSRIDFIGILLASGTASPTIELMRNAVEAGFSS